MDQDITQNTVRESSFGSDLAGIANFLIDPKGAAKYLPSKTFWIVPFIIAALVGAAAVYYITPMAIHAAEVSPVPDGATSDQMVKGATIGLKIQLFAGPVILFVIYAIEAALLLVMALILGAKAKFGELLNLVAGCGLIVTLAGIVATAILHFKGEVNSMAELRPRLGLDMFLPEGTNKFLMAAMSSFSIFQIWWVVMVALIFAAAYGVSKAKGFAAVLPLWLLGMGLTTFFAMFQK